MKIRKRIFKSGNSFVIYLDKTIMEGFDLKPGDLVDISDMLKVKYKKLPNNQSIMDIKKKVKYGDKTY